MPKQDKEWWEKLEIFFQKLESWIKAIRKFVGNLFWLVLGIALYWLGTNYG